MSTTNINKPYTPFQLPEDAKFDGTNFSGWKRAMLLHGANRGHNLDYKLASSLAVSYIVILES
jgi:hypothetical protein